VASLSWDNCVVLRALDAVPIIRLFKAVECLDRRRIPALSTALANRTHSGRLRRARRQLASAGVPAPRPARRNQGGVRGPGAAQAGPRLSQGQLDLLARSGAPLWATGTSGLTPAPVARVHDPSGVATHGVALWSAGHSRFRSARVVTALLVPCLWPIPRLSPCASQTPHSQQVLRLLSGGRAT
jgi:hypothetical protein